MASLINKENSLQMQRIFILKCEIESIVQKSQEKLYYANSRQLIKLIKKCELDDMLDS